MAAALIDRLLYHCYIVNIRRNIYGRESISSGCGPRRISAARESRGEGRPGSLARFGPDSDRSAPCIRPETLCGNRRENVRSARDVPPPKVCVFGCH